MAAGMARDGDEGSTSPSNHSIPLEGVRVVEGTPEYYERRAAEAEASAAYWECMASSERSPEVRALERRVAKEYHAEARSFRQEQKRVSLGTQRRPGAPDAQASLRDGAAGRISRAYQTLRSLLGLCIAGLLFLWATTIA
jgi:hypothetical protein